MARKVVGEEGILGARDTRASIHFQDHLVAAVAVLGSGRDEEKISDICIPAFDKLLPIERDAVVRFAAQAFVFLEVGILLESHHRARVAIGFHDVIGLVAAKGFVEIAFVVSGVRVVVNRHAAALVGHGLSEVSVVQPDLERK